MSNWTSLLVTTSLSPWLVSECCSHVSDSPNAAWLTPLSISVETPADLKNLRATAKRLKSILPLPLFESLDEEVREIAEDAKWAKTARGGYVSAINQWVEPFFSEFRARPQFGDVLIGSHATREVVFVTGFVQSENIFREFLSYVQSKKPPYKVMTDVRIGAWSGPKALQ
jgi:hypothetical protein